MLKWAGGLILAVVILGWLGYEGHVEREDRASAAKDGGETVYLRCFEDATSGDDCEEVSKKEALELSSSFYKCEGVEGKVDDIDLDDCHPMTGDSDEEKTDRSDKETTPDDAADPDEDKPEDEATEEATSETIGGGSQTSTKIDCPATNAEWLGMVTSELGENGNLVSNTVHNDDYDFVRVKLTHSWELPDGWESNVDGATTLEAGKVYSIYPPLVCQGQLDSGEAA